MRRSILSLLLVLAFLILPFQAALAQIPVTDVAHIAINYAGWAMQAGQWVTQLARMLQQYEQLVQTYQWAQHVAQQLENPNVYTVLSLFAIVGADRMTHVEGVSDFRRMVEGSIAFSTQIGGLYHDIYGQPINTGTFAPVGPNDWNGAAQRINQQVQNTDAAILETLAVVSQINNSLKQINDEDRYGQMAGKLKSSDITPHQSAQLNALSALYTAQNVDKLTQVMASVATVQVQKAAEDEYWQRVGLTQTSKDRDWLKAAGNSTRTGNGWDSGWKQH